MWVMLEGEDVDDGWDEDVGDRWGVGDDGG